MDVWYMSIVTIIITYIGVIMVVISAWTENLVHDL